MGNEITKECLEAFAKAFAERKAQGDVFAKCEGLAGSVRSIPCCAATDAEMPDVTVITVCFNPIADGRKQVLAQCLDSVQAQEGISLEHLVIDGASTDGTLDLLYGYKPVRHTLRVLSLKDSGIYEAMNRGIFLARGKYVAFLNTDDFYHDATGMRSSVDVLDKTGCDFSFAPVKVLSDKPRRFTHSSPCAYLRQLFCRSVISHQSLLLKRSVMVALGGFDEAYRSAGDYEFELRMLLAGYKGCYLDKAFASYRMTGQSSVDVTLSMKETAVALSTLYTQHMGADLDVWEAYLWHRYKKCPSPSLDQKLKALAKSAFIGVPDTRLSQVAETFRYLLKRTRYDIGRWIRRQQD